MRLIIIFLLLFNLLKAQAYNVSQIPYTPRPLTGTLVTSVDDAVYGPFNIGFTFCYWGNQYTQMYIGSNGWVGFSPGQPIAFTSQSIPSTNMFVPRNCIMGPWYDLNPGIAGAMPPTPIQYIYYQMYGISPNRFMVVSWNNSPLYQCISLRGTQQIILFEDGRIQNNILEKRVCAAWAGGTATQGLHNISGTQAIVVPGRNSSQWTVLPSQPQTWEYSPNYPIFVPCCPMTNLNSN